MDHWTDKYQLEVIIERIGSNCKNKHMVKKGSFLFWQKSFLPSKLSLNHQKLVPLCLTFQNLLPINRSQIQVQSTPKQIQNHAFILLSWKSSNIVQIGEFLHFCKTVENMLKFGVKHASLLI